jgi:hypothetical protein
VVGHQLSAGETAAFSHKIDFSVFFNHTACHTDWNDTQASQVFELGDTQYCHKPSYLLQFCIINKKSAQWPMLQQIPYPSGKL